MESGRTEDDVMKVIGITGGVGVGKTQVLEYLGDRYGAAICQADAVGKKLQKKGTECFAAIVEYFGAGILDEKGELDRRKLADIVFTDKEKLLALNAIVHPAVKEEIYRKIEKEKRRNTNLFFLESALLIEAHYEEACDELWYVHVDDEIRKIRLFYGRGYSSKKVDDIIASQLPKKVYLEHCDRVIDNSGTFEETRIQLDQAVADL